MDKRIQFWIIQHSTSATVPFTSLFSKYRRLWFIMYLEDGSKSQKIVTTSISLPKNETLKANYIRRQRKEFFVYSLQKQVFIICISFVSQANTGLYQQRNISISNNTRCIKVTVLCSGESSTLNSNSALLTLTLSMFLLLLPFLNIRMFNRIASML